jgi:predicted small metal-binding protein
MEVLAFETVVVAMLLQGARNPVGRSSPHSATSGGGSGGRMTRVVRCTCGVEIRDSEEARLVRSVQKHAKEAHDLDMSEEQVRAIMELE